MKYFYSDENEMKARIDSDKNIAYVKTEKGEKEQKKGSKILADIVFYGKEITKEQYESDKAF